MGGQYGYVLFALILFHVSWCTCVTIIPSGKQDALSESEAREVCRAMVQLASGGIHPNRDYHRGRIFYNNVNFDGKNVGKNVVIRLTRWNSECSVSMSNSDNTKGSDLTKEFKTLLQFICPINKESLYVGYERLSISDATYWIDYFVREIAIGEEEAALQSESQCLPENSPASRTDCVIQPFTFPGNTLCLGDSVQSPDGKYELIVSTHFRDLMTYCYAMVRDVKNGSVLWISNKKSDASFPPKNCFLRYRISLGTLELWNNDKTIWSSDSACKSPYECAGALSLGIDGAGVLNLFSSVGDYLHVYWSSKDTN